MTLGYLILERDDGRLGEWNFVLETRVRVQVIGQGQHFVSIPAAPQNGDVVGLQQQIAAEVFPL